MPKYFHQARSGLLRNFIGIALALASVGLLTVLIAVVHLNVHLRHVSMVYLIAVLVAAIRWSVAAAVAAAVSAIAACAFFFYPPIFDLRVSDPDQIVDLVMFVVVAVVTGQLAANVRQARLRRQAEALRDALIGSVSHELRTPLASILGSASVLAQSSAVAGDERAASLVQVVRDEAERLNADIQNLLDATRITSEGVRPRLEWVDPGDIANAAIDRKSRLLAGREVSLNVDAELPLVWVDASLVERALTQLIDNAAKYSPPHAPITINISALDGGVRLDVRDEGAGLTRDEREHVFERFYRSARHSGGIPGSGLGLWIARALVQACGGSVEADSAGEGKGTTVSIVLPPQSQPPAEQDNDE
jgi:two-component system sensor histidine kinase KdpD